MGSSGSSVSADDGAALVTEPSVSGISPTGTSVTEFVEVSKCRSAKVNNYDDEYKYGRFDVMLGGGVAVDFFDIVRFNIGYDYGLVNRYTGDADYTRHRSQLTVGVAYLF